MYRRRWIRSGTFRWTWVRPQVWKRRQRRLRPRLQPRARRRRRRWSTAWSGSRALNTSARRPRSNAHVVLATRSRPSSSPWKNCQLWPASTSRCVLGTTLEFLIRSEKSTIRIAFRYLINQDKHFSIEGCLLFVKHKMVPSTQVPKKRCQQVWH